MFFFQISICATVKHVKDETVQSVYGILLKKLETAVVDNTRHLIITMWKKLVNTVQINHSYTFINVSVRSHQNIKYLTTTKSTSIETASDGEIPSAIVELPDDPYSSATTVIAATVTEIKVQLGKMCKSCKK